MFRKIPNRARDRESRRILSVVANPHGTGPINVLRLLRSFLNYRLRNMFERKKALKKLSYLFQQFQGKEAIVIANGPSFNKLSVEKLIFAQQQGLKVFALNYFPLAPVAMKLVPDFLVLSDPETRPNDTLEITQRLWTWVRKHESVKLFLPCNWKKTIEEYESFEVQQRTFYFDDSSLAGLSKNINPTKPRGYLSVTAHKALALAIYLGFKEIDIIGFDNTMYQSLTCNKENQFFEGNSHFFDYHEDFVLKELYPLGVGDYFLDVALGFLELKRFEKFNIYNLDCESLVDAFPKKIRFQ